VSINRSHAPVVSPNFTASGCATTITSSQSRS
jgi:hypothetical protein